MSQPKVTLCRPDESAQALKLIARVFDKPGRRHSVSAFLPVTGDEVWCVEQDNEVVAALIARPLSLAGGEQAIAIGSVCTSPVKRKSGLASGLVDAACCDHESHGKELALLWAGEPLVGFYEKLGFVSGFRDVYCEITASAAEANFTFGPLGTFAHDGFETLRRRIETDHAHQSATDFVVRHLQDRRWCGVASGFPWSPEIDVLFDGPAETPSFYAIIGRGEQSVTVLEFVGSSEEFHKAIAWIEKNLEPAPIKFNVTTQAHHSLLQTIQVIERSPSLFAMQRKKCEPRALKVHTTWMNRV